jgi:hypothetical protein
MAMSSRALKLLAISALRSDPDFSKLHELRACRRQDFASFLTWLDHSGLALYLFARLRDCGELGHLPPDFREALEQRYHSNCKRMEEMLREFSKVNSALRNRAIPHAFLKGFTLTAEFCADPTLRHQSDIDILVNPDSVEEATQALIACGYSLTGSQACGELRFATPLQYIPSAQDDIYRVSPHREAELHTSIWEETGHVSMVVPNDCLERTRGRKLRDIGFSSLSAEDMFLVQVLHAFSHLLGSWVRVSWLWEIHCFLQTHLDDEELWQRIIMRAADDPTSRKAIGLVLCLTTRLFGGPIPEALNDWCVETLPERVDTWVRHFGTQWALSELGGSKVTLFIHEEFLNDASQWKSYLLRRLFPAPGRPSIGGIEASDVKTLFAGRVAQLLFVGRRLAFHTREIFILAREAFRWRQALQSGRKGRTASP